jgi:hypothetical protein
MYASTFNDRTDVKKNDDGIETEATFLHAVIGTASAVTNTPMGGDGGHGGETTVTLKADGGWFDLDILTTPGAMTDTTDAISLTVRGDSEAVVLADMLEFTAKSLRAQMAANSSKGK